MSVHLQREIERLNKELLSLGALVEEQVDTAVRAPAQRGAAAPNAVVERHMEVNRREVELEEECLKNSALHRPAAIELRLVVAVLKISSDVERIGDLAVNVARKAAPPAVGPPM